MQDIVNEFQSLIDRVNELKSSLKTSQHLVVGRMKGLSQNFCEQAYSNSRALFKSIEELQEKLKEVK